MKKKRFAFMIAAGILLCMSQVALSNENPADTNSESRMTEETEAWTVDEYIDDFGDSIGIKYMKTATEGTFSNTATSGSPLAAIVFFDPDIEEFSFRLIEYNSTKATYYDSDLIRILFKFDDEIEEHLLQGASPNGDVCLSASKEVDKANELKNKFTADPERTAQNIDMDILFHAMDVTLSPETRCGYYRLYNELIDGNDARCVIYIGSSKYSFTISSNGFSEAINVISEEKYQAAESLLKDREFDKAIDEFEKIIDYKDSGERVNEAKYGKAEELLDNGLYDEAADIFLSIKPYKDAGEKADEAKYENARALLTDGKYEEAKKLFGSLGDYLDASEMVNKCDEIIDAEREAAAENDSKERNTEKESADYRIMNGSCYLRSTPDYGDNIIDEIRGGTEVEYLSNDGGWVFIRVGDMEGYVGERFLQ